ncbi:hypothetical protein [Pseudonocardia oceani]|nr:hypothetical protein [Pseudonocardia oceani]
MLGHAHVHLVDKTALARSGADPDPELAAVLLPHVSATSDAQL